MAENPIDRVMLAEALFNAGKNQVSRLDHWIKVLDQLPQDATVANLRDALRSI